MCRALRLALARLLSRSFSPSTAPGEIPSHQCAVKTSIKFLASSLAAGGRHIYVCWCERSRDGPAVETKVWSVAMDANLYVHCQILWKFPQYSISHWADCSGREKCTRCFPKLFIFHGNKATFILHITFPLDLSPLQSVEVRGHCVLIIDTETLVIFHFRFFNLFVVLSSHWLIQP